MKNNQKPKLTLKNIENASERVKYLLQLTNLKAPQFAAKHNLALNTLKSWIYDRLKLSDKSCDIIIRTFAKEGIIIHEQWLLTGKGKPPEQLEIPDFQGLDIEIDQELSVFFNACTHPLYIQLEDHRMQPFFHEGDIVAGDATQFKTLKDALGHVCIVETNEGKKYFGKLEILQHKLQIRFSHPDFKDTVVLLEPKNITAVAPMLWLRRKQAKL